MESDTLTAREARGKLQNAKRRDVPLKQKAREVLQLGRRYLDVDVAYLTRIDTKTGRWETTVSTDSRDERLPEGLELDLQTTYCRRTIKADGPVALHDAPAQGMDDDPAFEAHGFSCYYGMELRLDGERYGTLCFVADDPRDAFEADETLFADLIRQLLEQELERQQHQTEFTRQTNLINVLNRVLRHNIRNEMSVIRGRTQIMADKIEDSASVDTVLEKVDGLIDLCQKAREVEEIVDQDHDPTQTNLKPLIRDVIDDISNEFPAASITLDADTDVVAEVLPSFERAVRELLENAAKHGGESPSVTVTATQDSRGIEVQVADTGPGIPDQEREVLKTGVETPLIHGSGLGLWLVHWIMTTHDGTIDATVTDAGTIMTMSVPRSSTTANRGDLADLRKARDRYKAAFDEAFDAHLLIDNEAHIIEANPEAATIYGLERAELRGRSLTEFFPQEVDFDNMWTAFQDRGKDRGIVSVVGADGQHRRIEYSATTDIIPGKHLLTARDVTKRQQRQTELERYETVLDSINDVAWVLDENKQVTLVNQATLETISDSREQIIGTPLAEFEDIFAEPEVFKTWEGLVEDVLAGDVAEGDLDVTFNLGDDPLIMNLRVAPVPDSDDPGGVAVVGSDITARKRREQSLEEYETIIESLGDAVYVLDEEGRFTYVNDELVELVGYDRETIIGNTPSLFKNPETVERSEQQLGRVLSSDGPDTVSFEMTIQPRDGDPITCRDNMCALPYEGDEFNGSVGTLRDITDRKRRERQLTALKQRYETLIESAPDPVFVADYETGEILETNAAAETLLGKPREEIVGQRQTALHPTDQAEQYRRFFEEYAQSGETLRQLPDGSNIYMTADDGRQIPIEITVGTASLPSGPAAIGIFRDISGSMA